MDAESRHKSSGSETKESLVFIAVAEAKVSAFLFQRPEPSCPQGDREMTPTHTTDYMIEKERSS